MNRVSFLAAFLIRGNGSECFLTFVLGPMSFLLRLFIGSMLNELTTPVNLFMSILILEFLRYGHCQEHREGGHVEVS